MPSVLVVERCPVCRAAEGDAFTFGAAALRACGGCGAIFNTRPAPPDEIYTDGYYTEGGEFGLDVMHPRFQAFLAEVGARRVRRIARAAGRRGGRWLDVGCGTGELAAAARDAGWAVVGVEPTADSARVAAGRGLDVRVTTLAESGLEAASFDVVTAFHVLEHLPDATGLLRELRAMTRPGGVVVAETPNWDARLRDAAGPDWPELRPREHITHFTPATLRRAFAEAGLEPVAGGTDGYASADQTLAELCETIGRPGLARRLRPLCRVRDAGGVRDVAPGPVVRAAVRALAAGDERRGRGRAVWVAGRAGG